MHVSKQKKKGFVTLTLVNCRPFNITQNTTSEAEGRQLTVGNVTQRLFSIDPCTYLKLCTATDKANGKSNPFTMKLQYNRFHKQIVDRLCGYPVVLVRELAVSYL